MTEKLSINYSLIFSVFVICILQVPHANAAMIMIEASTKSTGIDTISRKTPNIRLNVVIIFFIKTPFLKFCIKSPTKAEWLMVGIIESSLVKRLLEHIAQMRYNKIRYQGKILDYFFNNIWECKGQSKRY